MKKPVEILHVLHHDSCSSALDYAALMELLQRNFFQIDPEHIRFSILFIEFYGFNQFYGYNENLLERDQLLISKIGKKLSSALTENDMLVRVGDYQYIVVQADIPERVSSGLARQIMHLFSEPCMINGDMFYIYTSIGISFYPDEGTDLYALIKVAENKMKKVQKNGKNLISTVQDSSILLTERQMELKQALPAAIENGEIYFLYQAQ
ncbi:diguanylate cyclase, partial [Sulfurovum sp.]|uniref:diguanylate cyclase domain-containing protein n=2 Tax=Sulfurovum sp. TaxID=1969726 RepID=UPI0026070B05